MPYQIIGGQFVDALTGQVMTPEEIQNEMYLSALAGQAGGLGMPGGAIGGYQIVGYAHDGQPVYQSVGQLSVRTPSAIVPAGPARIPQLSPSLMTALRGRLMTGLTGPTPASAAPALATERPGPIDLSPLAIDSGAAIAAGVTQLIPTVLQTIFRPERLSIGATVAPFFTITQLAMGNVPLTANVGEFAAETFSDDAVGANIRKVTGQPGQTLFVGVRNEDVNARRFRATFFGASSQPEGCRS